MNDPRKEVLRRLSERVDYWTTRKLTYMVAGEMVNAEGAEQMMRWCKRAYEVEANDPRPAAKR